MTINNTTVVNSLYGRSISGTSTTAFVDIFMDRDPNPQDIQYVIQQKWLNTTEGHYWELQNFSSLGGVVTANWVKIASTQHVETLTGNTGGAVGPTANNINVVGDGTTITVAGNPATSTLTISTEGAIATSFTTNSGIAIPIGGNLNIFGGTGMTTSGATDTVTVTGKIALAAASSSLDNDGVSSFNSDHFTVDGNGFVSAANGVALQFDTQTGTATPAAGVINIVGDGAITTSGAGNTVTVHGDGLISSINIQTFTTSGTYTPTAGMLYCEVECVGGGGAGGGAFGNGTSNISAGAGGGGGGYAKSILSAASIGVSKTVTIGAGGTGVSGTNGNPGGTTSLGVLVSASGGGGGSFFDSNAASIFALGGLGGSVLTGTVTIAASPGTSAGTGINAPAISAAGGASAIGGGGGQNIGLNSSGTDFSSPGNPGVGYGGGGGGALLTGTTTSVAGGAGASGVVIITEYIG